MNDWHCAMCEDVAWMREHGASWAEAARRAGTTEAALEKHLRFARRTHGEMASGVRGGERRVDGVRVQSGGGVR